MTEHTASRAPTQGGGLEGRVVLATALASALSPLNSTMLSVAIRPIGATFAVTESRLTGALVTSYLVTSIVAGAPCGKLADDMGHRRALSLGQIAFAIGSLVALFAPNVPFLVAARIAMAAAGSLIIPSGLALLRAEAPPESRGKIFGIFGATMAFSATLGPVLGGQLTSAFGWRSVFVVNLVIVPLSALLAGRHGAQSPRKEAPKRSFDWVGTLLLGASLTTIVLSVGRGRMPNFQLLAAGLLLMAVFLFVERRVERPVVDLGLFRIRAFVAGTLVIMLQNLTMYALLFEIPLVCGVALKASASRTGPLLISMMAPTILLSPVAGRLVNRWGPRALAVAGTLASAGGVLLLRLLPLTSLLSPVPGLVVLGVGLGMANAPAQTAALSAVAPEKSASAAGMSSTMRYLGGVVGTLVLGILFAGELVAPGVLATHGSALSIFFVATLLSIVSASLLPTSVQKTSTP